MKFKTATTLTFLIFFSVIANAQSIEEQQFSKSMQEQMALTTHDFNDYLETGKDNRSSEELLLTKLCKAERDAVKLVYIAFNNPNTENKDHIIKLSMNQRDSIRDTFKKVHNTTHEKACKMSQAQFYTLMDKHLTTSTALVSDFSESQKKNENRETQILKLCNAADSVKRTSYSAALYSDIDKSMADEIIQASLKNSTFIEKHFQNLGTTEAKACKK